MRGFAEKANRTEILSASPARSQSASLYFSGRNASSLFSESTIGDHGVQQTFSGHNFGRVPVHPPEGTPVSTKLVIASPGDGYEEEANRIADRVTAVREGIQLNSALPRIQRITADRGEPAGAVPASVHRALASPGQPLEPTLRRDMEQRFNHDFSRVRIHSDGAGMQSAQDVNARAYTLGRHIAFGDGQFTPRTEEGRRLIAHELTHVVQQTGQSSMSAVAALHSGEQIILQRQPVKPDPKKQDPKKEDAKKEEKPGPTDIAVVLSPDPNFLRIAAGIAPNARILRATSLDDLAKQLKTIKAQIGTLFFVAHMNADGDLEFDRPGVQDFKSGEQIASKIKGSVQVENLDFRGCNLAQAPGEMEKVRAAVNANKVTGSTCTLVSQIADPIKVNGKPITRPEDLKDDKDRAAFATGFKDLHKLFEGGKKKCILDDSVEGYFKTGGRLMAYWANPESMADDEGWDDNKSICFTALKTQKIDPKKPPVIGPNDCQLIEIEAAKKKK
jgi:hypothetical protein